MGRAAAAGLHIQWADARVPSDARRVRLLFQLQPEPLSSQVHICGRSDDVRCSNDVPLCTSPLKIAVCSTEPSTACSVAQPTAATSPPMPVIRPCATRQGLHARGGRLAVLHPLVLPESGRRQRWPPCAHQQLVLLVLERQLRRHRRHCALPATMSLISCTCHPMSWQHAATGCSCRLLVPQTPMQ